MPDPVVTEVVRVVVHPGAAAVERAGAISITASGEVAIAGLPVELEDDSVEVVLDGPGVVTAARVELAQVGPAEAGTAEAEVVAARAALARCRAEEAAVAQTIAALDGLAATDATVERDAPAPWDAVVAARLELLALGRGQLLAHRARQDALVDELERAERALAAAEERLARATSASALAGAMRKTIVAAVSPRGEGGPATIRCRYRAPGARWAPTYVARLVDGALALERRAVVAQATGEDWRGVALELSTAAPGRRVRLPELAALRIGRAQPTPAKAGWRAPPVGVDELYRDWDRAFAQRIAPPPEARPQPPPAPPPPQAPMAEALADEDGFFVGGEVAAASMPSMPPASIARGRASMPAQDLARAAPKKTRAFMMGAAGGAAPPPPAPPPEPTAPIVEDDLLAFAALAMPGPSAPGRGRLTRTPARADAEATAARTAAREQRIALGRLAAPRAVVEPGPGQYDYAFAAAAAVDVPADGGWHAVALGVASAPARIRHVVVPAVAADVYRVATAGSPFDEPLLAGPIDVYDGDELVLTAELAETAPGGTVTVGLGVDPDVKVARNLRYREESAGVLRGSLRLIHELSIDAEQRGPRAIELEIRERLPVPAPDTDEVEVELDEVVPPWEPWRPEPERGEAPLRGGHRWLIELAAGARTQLRLTYAIKIAGKHELVGGNRRDV